MATTLIFLHKLKNIILNLPAFRSVLILKGTLQGVSVNLQVKAGYENPYCLLSCNPHVGTSGHTGHTHTGHTRSPREDPRDHEAGGGHWAPPKQIRAASTICMQCNLLVCSTHSVVTTCGTMRAIMIGLVLVVQCNILRNRFKHLLSSTASPGGHPQSLFLKHSFTFIFFDRRNIAVQHFCTCANILKEGAGHF